MYRTDTLEQVASVPVGNLPHGIWPSGDGTRVYAGLENGDAVAAIDTLTNRVIAPFRSARRRRRSSTSQMLYRTAPEPTICSRSARPVWPPI